MYNNGAHLPPIVAAPTKTARLQNYHSNLEEYLRKLSYQLEALVSEQVSARDDQASSMNIMGPIKVLFFNERSMRDRNSMENQCKYRRQSEFTMFLPKKPDDYLLELQTEISKAEKQHELLEENMVKFLRRTKKNTDYQNVRTRMDVLEKEKYREEDNWKKMIDSFEDRRYTVPGEVYDLDTEEDRKLQADINAKKNLLEKQKDYIVLLEDWVSTTQHDINETEALALVSKDDQDVELPKISTQDGEDQKSRSKILAERNLENVERDLFKVKIDIDSKKAAIGRYRSLLEALRSNRKLLQRSRSAEYPKPERSKPVERKKTELIEMYRKEAAITSRQERLSKTALDLREKLNYAKNLSQAAELDLKKILEAKEARLANPHYGHLDHDPSVEELVRLESEVAQLRAVIADKTNEANRFQEELSQIRENAKQWKTTAQDFAKLQKKIVEKHKLKAEIRGFKMNYSNLQKQLRVAQKDLELSVLRRECIVDKAHASVVAKNSVVRSQQIEENDKLQRSIASIRKVPLMTKVN
ncbi:hypothetical protein QR680_002812 [Steinernema hermaphroditum]|uniref:DUF4201 domain-containing protein n=1 Tax=Steinernema hermaphroditum TaxID=289476 RepID=A0AA39H492_9BILA|nr:hypothetical protein QR680_002812 [Steinernema hermaphroditum]